LPNKALIKENFKYDITASIVVSLVALPLCLGIALASGSSLLSGLISGIIGGIVVGFISSSHVGVSGPAAGLAVIVAASIQTLGMEMFLVAVVIAGAFQLIAGFLKAGVVAHFFPSSVIKGMLSGIGLILILKQIPHIFGIDTGSLDFEMGIKSNLWVDISQVFSLLEPGALIISLLGIGTIILWQNSIFKNYFKKVSKIPASLVVVGLGIFLNNIFLMYFPEIGLTGADIQNGKETTHLVNLPVVNEWSEYLGFLSSPDFKSIGNFAVWKAAFTLFVVASLESLLCLEATDKIDPYRRQASANRELIAQGTGNVLAGLIGGIPITQVIVRSAANVNSGGRTKVSTIFHGFFLLAFVFFIPKFINQIPLASLAAILLGVGYKLCSPKIIKEQISLGKNQYLPYLVTIIGMVLTDMLIGIGIGMIFAVFNILRMSYNYTFWEEGETSSRREVSVVLPKEVNYLNAISFQRYLETIAPSSTVTINGSSNKIMSSEFLEVIKDFSKNAQLKKIKLTLKNIRGIEEVEKVEGRELKKAA
jgi:MFS superfamily sulfate permease-like transporter